MIVFGGGVAGLWILDALTAAGRSAILIENLALGAGQTLQSQGIVHGGGKYALRGVRDFTAARAIREMPERWRQHLRGAGGRPDLSSVEVLSERTYLWDLRAGGVLGALRRKLLPVVARSGLLHTRPVRLAPDEWPEGLRATAASVYAMDEPVVATRSLVGALALPHRERILLAVRGAELTAGDSGWTVTVPRPGGNAPRTLTARMLVLAAGGGNQSLLAAAGVPDAQSLMQRRPLQMIMLRGDLPEIQGHWVRDARTSITITTASAERPDERIWLVGGQVAEVNANVSNDELVQARGLDAIRAAFPGLELAGCEVSNYLAVRAEGRTASALRPEGVHLSRPAPHLLAAWPTKLALAPVLADTTVAAVAHALGPPSGDPVELPASWPRPALGSYPWEAAVWNPVP